MLFESLLFSRSLSNRYVPLKDMQIDLFPGKQALEIQKPRRLP
jgi:hypothetical protein